MGVAGRRTWALDPYRAVRFRLPPNKLRRVREHLDEIESTKRNRLPGRTVNSIIGIGLFASKITEIAVKKLKSDNREANYIIIKLSGKP